jgi:hypothetical protein
MDRRVTARTADPDLYVETCLSRACEALGLDATGDVIGTPIPIEFEEPPPITVRLSHAAIVVTTESRAHRVGFARLALLTCAVVALVAAAGAVAKSPLGQELLQTTEVSR